MSLSCMVNGEPCKVVKHAGVLEEYIKSEVKRQVELIKEDVIKAEVEKQVEEKLNKRVNGVEKDLKNVTEGKYE